MEVLFFIALLLAIGYFGYRNLTREERNLTSIANMLDSGKMLYLGSRTDGHGDTWHVYEHESGMEMLYRAYHLSDGEQREDMIFYRQRLYWYKFVFAKGGVRHALIGHDSPGVHRSGLESSLRSKIDAVGLAARDLIGMKLR